MGLFTSLCKNCDEELNWFLEVKGGITCRNCGEHNTEKDIWNNQMYPRLGYWDDKESFIKKRKAIRERKLKIGKLRNG